MENILNYIPIFLIAGGGGYIWWMNKSGKKMDIRKALHMVKNKQSVEEIKSVHQEAVQVVANVKDLDKKSVAKQKKIKAVIEKAAVEIEAIDKAKTVDEVLALNDEGWDDI